MLDGLVWRCMNEWTLGICWSEQNLRGTNDELVQQRFWKGCKNEEIKEILQLHGLLANLLAICEHLF